MDRGFTERYIHELECRGLPFEVDYDNGENEYTIILKRWGGSSIHTVFRRPANLQRWLDGYDYAWKRLIGRSAAPSRSERCGTGVDTGDTVVGAAP